MVRPTANKNQDEEERLEEALTSSEMRLCMALCSSLETKLSQVDDLLESLQEEEWQDEEEGIIKPVVTSRSGANQASLLDQILAMILGSTASPMDGSEEKFRIC